MGISDEVRDAIRADQQRRAEFAAKVAAEIASGLCDQCAHGYHINHTAEWRPSVLDAEVINGGAGECTECPCEWRN